MKTTLQAIENALNLAKAIKPETTLTASAVCHLAEAKLRISNQIKHDEDEQNRPKAAPLDVLEQASDGTLIYWCPGCREHHGIWLKAKPNPTTGCAWSWNGSKLCPTVSPSLVVKAIVTDGKVIQPLCHSFIRDGKIEFLGDCQHKLAGHTVPMLPEVDEDPTWPARESHHPESPSAQSA